MYLYLPLTYNIKLILLHYKSCIYPTRKLYYKKDATKRKRKINKKGKRILKGKDVVNRMHINGEINCFIAMKDHKDNFENKSSVTLINPAKNEFGCIFKVLVN